MAKQTTTRTAVQVGLVAFAVFVVYEILKNLNKPAGYSGGGLTGGGGGSDSYAPYNPSLPNTPPPPNFGASLGPLAPPSSPNSGINPLSAYLAGNNIPTNYDNSLANDFIPSQPLLNLPNSDLLSISPGTGFANILPGGGGLSQTDVNSITDAVGAADATPAPDNSILALFGNVTDDFVSAVTGNDLSAFNEQGIPDPLAYDFADSYNGFDPTANDNGTGLGTYDNNPGDNSFSGDPGNGDSPGDGSGDGSGDGGDGGDGGGSDSGNNDGAGSDGSGPDAPDDGGDTGD